MTTCLQRGQQPVVCLPCEKPPARACTAKCGGGVVAGSASSQPPI